MDDELFLRFAVYKYVTRLKDSLTNKTVNDSESNEAVVRAQTTLSGIR